MKIKHIQNIILDTQYEGGELILQVSAMAR